METLRPPPDGDQNRAPALLAIFWAPFVLTVALLSARIFVRIKSQTLGVDDYSMFLAWIFYATSLSVLTASLVKGGARHMFYLTADEIPEVWKLNTISQPFSSMSSALGKSSVAFLILRLIGPITIWQKWFIYINGVLFFIVMFLTSIFALVKCSPTRAIWENVIGAKCWSPNIIGNFNIFGSAYGGFVDFTLALVPATIIWGMQLDIRQKVNLCLLLGLGAFAGVCCSIKTRQFGVLATSTDLTWDSFGITAWAYAEASLVIICGSIPTVKPLINYLFKGIPVGPKGPHYPHMRKYHAHKSTNGSSRASRVCWPRGNIKVAPTSDSNLLRQYAADTGLSRRGTTADTDQDTGLQDWDSGEGLGRQIDRVCVPSLALSPILKMQGRGGMEV